MGKGVSKMVDELIHIHLPQTTTQTHTQEPQLFGPGPIRLRALLEPCHLGAMPIRPQRLPTFYCFVNIVLTFGILSN